MKHLLLTTCAVALFATPSFAEPTCVAIGDIGTLSGDIGNGIVNNLSLSAGDLYGQESVPTAILSYSVANRNSGPVYVSVDVIFLDSDDFLIAAVSAVSSSAIRPGMTEALSGRTILSKPDFDRIDEVCVHIAGIADAGD
ncbi:hypothetical protein [Martelella radicis]|uniref:Uncharacterized protein n=1 Tax=Martelella radicis TaxID=1397476 RepID=A0A7W6KKJ6_9HYPH|nr:hypothetical protein [Martelella radicis]MBB4122956.1 hypothetical protein [Martelella radicis]